MCHCYIILCVFPFFFPPGNCTAFSAHFQFLRFVPLLVVTATEEDYCRVNVWLLHLLSASVDTKKDQV